MYVVYQLIEINITYPVYVAIYIYLMLLANRILFYVPNSENCATFLRNRKNKTLVNIIEVRLEKFNCVLFKNKGSFWDRQTFICAFLSEEFNFTNLDS